MSNPTYISMIMLATYKALKVKPTNLALYLIYLGLYLG